MLFGRTNGLQLVILSLLTNEFSVLNLFPSTGFMKECGIILQHVSILKQKTHFSDLSLKSIVALFRSTQQKLYGHNTIFVALVDRKSADFQTKQLVNKVQLVPLQKRSRPVISENLKTGQICRSLERETMLLILV